jgi:HupE / UreJ protein
MGRTFLRLAASLCLVAMLSTLCLLRPQGVAAHEVTPTIGDLTVTNGQLTLDLRLNVEAFVAGINLDGMDDTDASDQSSTYDRLRALNEAEFTPKVLAFARTWIKQIIVMADGPVALDVASIVIPDVGAQDLPRSSHLILTGKVTPRADRLVLTWPKGAGNLVLRQQGVDDPFTGYVEAGKTTPEIPIDGGIVQTAQQVFLTYIPVGFDHIIPKGLDHILFVLGLFFLSSRLGPLLWQISAFTLAHTVTLGLGALGWITVPAAIVEPLIAASIVYVAVENMLVDRLHKWRIVVIFGFGLLHGLGFASVLAEFGLPAGQFIPALIGFNIGVEIGQLSVIAAAFLTVGIWFRKKPWYRTRISIPASVAIALIASFWFVQRVI